MLYVIAEQLGFPGVLNLIRYISFRAGGATATALLIGLLLGPWFISYLRERQGKGQPIRADGPQTHLAKRGTPTMGGLLILISLSISTLLWMDLRNPYVWACLMVGPSHTSLYLPLVQGPVLELGWLYIVFGAFVIVAFGNAVNLTDGLDGLATMPVVIAALAFLLIAYLVGNFRFAEYLGIPHLRGVGDLTVLLLAIVGACLAFLWFNAPPAAVFMGDTGSLALGGALGAVAVATHNEFVLAIIGGLFVVEALSVVIQVVVYKRTGKRVFLMAP